MMIGELSTRTGVNIETIRYYERIGILPPTPRTPGGRRVFDDGLMKRLNFVRRSRELGFGLDHIRQMLEMVDGGGVTCTRVRHIAAGRLEDVRAKIADLKRMEIIRDRTVADCAGGESPDCPIIETLYSGN